MKKLLLITIFSIACIGAFAQETATVYFIRPYAYSGSMVSFKCFIDDEFVCKLNNVRHSIHQVTPGEHTFYLRVYKKTSTDNERVSKLTLNVEAGKAYYLQVNQVPGLIFQELTATNATPVLKATKEDKKCL